MDSEPDRPGNVASGFDHARIDNKGAFDLAENDKPDETPASQDGGGAADAPRPASRPGRRR